MKIWIMSLLSAAALAACAVQDEPAPPASTEDTALPSSAADPTEAEIDVAAKPDCCQSGAWLCPNNIDASVDYDQPTCGITKPAARNACEAACSVTCVDTGWHNVCGGD